MDAAPIVKWSMGKHYTRVIEYYQRKKTLIDYWEIEDASISTLSEMAAFNAAFDDPKLREG